ncbi:MAG: type I DNA topoisomerase [Deltaproteobacteria bacterium]|nr:type I DNA topoisomerase [Candidatus Zymogenaceae bacterium]
MSKSLVIVESPAKAKTIEKFLGKDFKVLASYGHVRSIPSKSGSVDIQNDFTPTYEVIEDKKTHINTIKKSLKNVDSVYLATDLDREGEAIAWHLVNVLNIDNGGNGLNVHRIVFSEITKSAVLESIENPRKISRELVDAQRAREILDYLVGFNLSPFLWRKVKYGLSAGRVQSVALRMICEREREIEAFSPQEYWTIEGIFTKTGEYNPFSATMITSGGNKLKKFDLATEQDAQNAIDLCVSGPFVVGDVKRKDIKRNPPPPFITSTMQQEASRKLGFPARKTMRVAQKLYEGKEVGDEQVGLITYMRTDSTNVAASALAEVKQVITDEFGAEYSLAKPRVFKKKAKGAQEAHEAIRPTSFTRTPKLIKKYLTKDEFRLYELIWKRAAASQMAQMVLDSVSAELLGENESVFRASGSTVKFPGFSKVYMEGRDDEAEEQELLLPVLAIGDMLDLIGMVPEQHFTAAPPRYSEASLIKALEERGIGRPSTYAGIINTIQARKYVTLRERRFYPEDIGMIVNDLLVKHFQKYVDYDFTAHLEEDLDSIASGDAQWRPMIKEFWEPFYDLLLKKDKEVRKEDVYNQKTDKICPQCGKPIVIKLGKFGRFYACSGYPDCRYVASLEGKEQEIPQTNEVCDLCGKPMQVKMGKYGQFLGCTGYPECRNIKPLKDPLNTGVTCPLCGKGTLIEREVKKGRTKGKLFYGCSEYPDCTYIVNNRPYPTPCPKCANPFLVYKGTKTGDGELFCPAEGCGYSREVDQKDLEKLEKK